MCLILILFTINCVAVKYGTVIIFDTKTVKMFEILSKVQNIMKENCFISFSLCNFNPLVYLILLHLIANSVIILLSRQYWSHRDSTFSKIQVELLNINDCHFENVLKYYCLKTYDQN